MIVLNGFAFAQDELDAAFTCEIDESDTPEAEKDYPCVGFYEVSGSEIYLFDENRERVGGIRSDGLVYRCTPRGDGFFYQPAPPQLIGGIDAMGMALNDEAKALVRQTH